MSRRSHANDCLIKESGGSSFASGFLGHRRCYPGGTGALRMNTELVGALTGDFSTSRIAKSKRRAEFRSPGQYVIWVVVSLFQFCMVV